MTERNNPVRRQATAKTPWHEAIRSGDPEKVRRLLQEGADIDALDEHGQTGLMNAVYWGNLELTALLIRHGADLDRKAKLNLTALYLAVIGGRTAFVRALVKAGAATDIKGSTAQYDRTPLEYARQLGSPDIVRILEDATRTTGDER